jgi:hypothetical protein
VGDLVSAKGYIAEGKAEDFMAKSRAQQLRQQALADRAESQAVAGAERKKAKQLNSRIRSASAASGTGMDSPDVVNAMADVEGQGVYNALSALYSGETAARTKNLAALMSEYEGKQAKRNAKLKSTAAIISGVANIANTAMSRW